MYSLKPTREQLDFIKVLENKLDIVFTGITRRDAKIFIAKNYKTLVDIRRDIKYKRNRSRKK